MIRRTNPISLIIPVSYFKERNGVSKETQRLLAKYFTTQPDGIRVMMIQEQCLLLGYFNDGILSGLSGIAGIR